MCRLLGIYGKVDFWKEIVFEFGKLAEHGNLPPEKGLTPGHMDGWGIAMSNHDASAMMPVIRQPGSAHSSPCFQHGLDALQDAPQVLLCHLRKASPGIPVNLSNVHPFTHNGWSFAHNGTVFQAESLARDPLLTLAGDRSDSEHLFHYLLTELAKQPESWPNSFAIAAALARLPGEYTSLTSLLSNGRELYAIRSFRKYDDYYTLYSYRLSSAVLVCSEPLETRHLQANQWRPIAADRLMTIHADPPRIEETPLSRRAGT